jgi:hypothetical protein
MQRSSQRAASLPKVVLLVTAVAALAAPAPASAHIRTGSAAVDYRVRVFPTRLPLTAHVYLGDRAVRLSVRPGYSVTVLGYADEPFLRIDDAGVTILKSPTAAALRITPRHTSGRSFLWHDARVRGLPPEIDRGRWTIPLLVDGRRTRLGILAGAGTIVTAAAFAFASNASEGRWVEAGNEAVFALVGLAVVARGSRDARKIAAGALGLLALAAALTKVPVFLHGVVLSALPATPARSAVALTIWIGAAVTALGLVLFAELLE